MRKYPLRHLLLVTCAILVMIASGTLAQEATPSEYINQLNYKEASARAYAAYALGQVGDATAVDALIPLLRDEDKYVRAIVAEALGKIGGAQAVDALTNVLDDSVRFVRWSAARALKRLQPEGAHEMTLYRQELSHPEAAIRLEAATRLSEHSPEEARQYQRFRYLYDLQDSDPQLRAAAAKALATLGDVTTAQPLAAALGDSDPLVRRNAVVALSQLFLRSNDVSLLTPAIAPLIQLLQDEVGLVSTAAATLLTQIGTPAVNALTDALRDEDAAMRAVAVGVLGSIHPENLRDYQLSRYLADLQDRDDAIRAQAAIALGAMGDERAIEPLIAALRDLDKTVRKNTTDALTRIGEPAVPMLIPLLGDSETSVRVQAAIALRDIGSRLADPASLRLARDAIVAAFVDFDAPIHSIAIQMLQQMGSQGADWLVPLLDQRDDAIRAKAAVVLGQIQPERAHEYQIVRYRNDLNSPDASVRAAAVSALAGLADTSLVEQFIALLADEDGAVRKAAADALERTGPPAVGALIRGLTHENRIIRRHAFGVLAEIAPEARVDVLRPAMDPAMAALREPDRSIQASASVILTQLGEIAVDPLVALLGDTESPLHPIAIGLLARIGTPAVGSLETALNSPNRVIRSNAVAALRQITPDRAEHYQVSRAINDLKDTDPGVRAVAAFQLGRMQDSRALNPLIAALKDKDFRVRAGAADSLAYLADKRAVKPLESVEDDDPVDMVKRVARESLDRLKRLP